MVTLFVQLIWMIAMLVWDMANEWFPFGNNEGLEACFSRCCTPVNVTTDSLYPIFDSLAPLQFTCTDQLFGNRTCYVPNIIVVSGIDTVFSNPLRNSLMAIRDKGGNRQSKMLQICKTSLCPFKFCSLTTSCFICLRIHSWYWYMIREFINVCYLRHLQCSSSIRMFIC